MDGVEGERRAKEVVADALEALAPNRKVPGNGASCRDLTGLSRSRLERHAGLRDMLQEPIEHARAHEGVDICSMLVQARYDDGAPMSDSDIRDELRA